MIFLFNVKKETKLSSEIAQTKRIKISLNKKSMRIVVGLSFFAILDESAKYHCGFRAKYLTK